MNYTEPFNRIAEHCLVGESSDVDYILNLLDLDADLPTTRAVDYYLGLISNPRGVDRIEFYLFNGSRIQRNYCTLFFARRNDWDTVNRAYKEGLIDRIQAYSR